MQDKEKGYSGQWEMINWMGLTSDYKWRIKC